MQAWVKSEKDETTKVGWRYMVRKVFVQPDGELAEYYTNDKVGARSVAVIALTSDNAVIIAKQFRPGPEKVMYELPGGGVEHGEDLEAAALRELEEETGYTSNEIDPLGMVHKDAYTNTTSNYFIARNCQRIGSGQNLDHGEFIDVERISIDKLIHNARSGMMTDVEGVFLAYDQLRENTSL